MPRVHSSLLLWLIIALFPMQSAYSIARIYVNINNPAPGNGSSWATAYNDLAAALAAGGNSDTFLVAAGTYYPTSTTDRTKAFTPGQYQILYGGFNGTETWVSQRDWKANVTILSGDIGVRGTNTDNSYSVVRIYGISSTVATMDGFTIRDGYADNGTTQNLYNTGGGASLISDGTSTFVFLNPRNCIFTNNYAVYGGAIGIFGTAGSGAYSTITRCTFLQNTAYTGGALSYTLSGSGTYGNNTVDNCIFISNTAGSGQGSVVANIADGCYHRPDLQFISGYDNGADLAYSLHTNGGTGATWIGYGVFWTSTGQYGASTFSNTDITWSDCDINVPDVIKPANVLNADPLFVDNDLHVAACSPLIDATSSTVNYYTLDFDGNARAQGKIDIGAYESTKTKSPAPTAATQYFCQNVTATPLEATGDNLLWYTASTGGTGDATAPTPATATTGFSYYYVTQTVAGSCESDRTLVSVYVNSQPATPAVIDVLYCQYGTATALGTNSTAFLWYEDATGGTGTSTAPTPETDVAGEFYFYKVAVNSSGCESERAKLTVTVNAASAAPAVTDVTYCLNATASPLTATGTSLKWYTSATGGTGDATAPTPSTATNGTTIYYVTQTETGGCESERVPLTVTIGSTTTAPVVTDVTYCLNTTATALTATGTDLLWYTSATGGTGDATAPTPVTTSTGNTSYFVTQTVTDGCESDRAEIVVTVAHPTAPVVSDITYCQNETATVLSTNTTNNTWYTTETGGTGTTTAPTPLTDVASVVTYYVLTTDADGCESDRAALTVTVNATSAMPVVADITYCMNEIAAPLTATGNNLLWYTTETGGTGDVTAPTPSTAVNGTTTYYVSQTDAGGCESKRAALTVTIGSQATTPLVTPLTYCQNVAAPALSASGTNLTWYTDATGGAGSTMAPAPSTSTLGNTSYYVTQKDADGCESERAELVVTVKVAAAIPVVTDLEYCLNESVPALTATGTNLRWYTAETGGTGSATAPFPVTIATGTTTYYVSQNDGCESERAALTVTVNSTSSPIVTPVTICQATATSPLTAEGTNLLWYTDATGGTGSTTAPTPVALVPGTTTYYVTQTDVCESARATLTVTVVASPEADFSYTGACAGTPATITLIPAASSTAFYTWNFYNAISVSGDDPGPYEVLWTNPGDYTVTLMAYDGICETKVEHTVTVGLAPEIQVTPNNQAYCINTPVLLSATGAATYEWSPNDNLSATTGSSVTATFRGDVVYTVTGTDADGCVATTEVSLIQNPACEIYYILPTAFSPNGDGLNDYFRVKTTDLPKSFSMLVFNRVGMLVFESHDPNNGWNGFFKNQEAPVGEYVYFINAVTSEGKKIEQKGGVMLTR